MARRITKILVFHAQDYGVSGISKVNALTLGTLDPTNDLLNHIIAYPVITEVLGELASMTLSILGASEFATKRLITERTRLYFKHDDGLVVPWRVRSVALSTSGNSDVVIQADLMVADLGFNTFRYVEPSGRTVYRLPLRRISFSTALALVFDADYGVPPPFRLGVIEEGLANILVTFDANATDFLEIISTLCKSVADTTGDTCEFEVTYAGDPEDQSQGDLLIKLNFYTEAGWTAQERINGFSDGTRRPIDEPGHNESNRKDLRIVDGQGRYSSFIIPFGGNDTSVRVGIGGIEWEIGSMVWKPNPMETHITMEEDIIYLPDIYKDSLWSILTNEGDNFEIIRVIEPNILVVFGDVTVGPVATSLKILSVVGAGKTDSGDGTEVSYVYDPAAEILKGRSELVVDFPDIPPYDNIYEVETGESGAMDGFVTDFAFPVIDPQLLNWNPDAGVTLSKTTSALFVRFGIQALKVVFNSVGDKVLSTLFQLTPTQVSPMFSFYVAGRCTKGAVRISLEDSTGRLEPIGAEKVEMRVDETGAIGGGGLLPVAGMANLRFVALEDDSELYIDAITITQSQGIWEYSKDMGPRALYFAAVRYLKREAGLLGQVTYEADAYDAHVLDELDSSFDEIVVGSNVRIRDLFHEPTFTWMIDFIARVTQTRVEWDPDFAGLVKEINLEARQPNLVRRFTFQVADLGGLLSSGRPQPAHGKQVTPRELLQPLTSEKKTELCSVMGKETSCEGLGGQARIVWCTQPEGTSQVFYGLVQGGPYPSETTLDPAFVHCHDQIIESIVLGVTHYFFVESVDRQGNIQQSIEFLFCTGTVVDITPSGAFTIFPTLVILTGVPHVTVGKTMTTFTVSGGKGTPKTQTASMTVAHAEVITAASAQVTLDKSLATQFTISTTQT